MSVLGDAKMYGRFAWGLRSFLHHTISLEEARATVRQRMEQREGNFLRLVERGIFGYPHSPYLPLLKLAGCEMGDIRNMVQARGLEGTLMALLKAGVYVSFEEFKGREPIARGGQMFPVNARDFNNPFPKYYYQAETGGTTGAGTRVDIELDHLDSEVPLLMLVYDAHGILNLPTVLWRNILPDSGGIGIILRHARFVHPTNKWFSPLAGKDVKALLKHRLASRYIVTMGRLYGSPLPWPELAAVDEASVVSRWVAKTLKTHGACLIRALVTPAMRVCLAACEEGLDLTGATFLGGGEPPTPAKVREITSTGARYVAHYAFTEAGLVGAGCARPADINDTHFLKDTLALIQHPRQVPGFDISVDAFHFTTLMPASPKLMLNVESDDYGVIEKRACGCPLEEYGFVEHLRHIRSFSKLTGEGVTLVGSEMLQILEDVLPSRFGGTALDYQLLEEEDEAGFTRLSLIVSPRIEIYDETALISVVLDALNRGSDSAKLAGAIWNQAGSLRIKRQEPIATARGKLMPLHLLRSSPGMKQ